LRKHEFPRNLPSSYREGILSTQHITLSAIAVSLSFAFAHTAHASGVLDGRVFSGMIGPAEDPDLEDRLSFDEGHFWSDICTRCGFVPGPYIAEETPDGVRFSGILRSDSRGRFDYDGVVKHDGSIRVSIKWERRRWYWTSRREITFVGKQVTDSESASLSQVRQAMEVENPDSNPMCARF
jgi:hypothetical protein